MKLLFASLLLALSLIAIPSLQAADPSPAGRKIQVKEFDALRGKPGYQILDVRSPEEFKAGHVAGATNLNVHDPEFAKRLATLDKSKTYLVHCARGARSAMATQQMLKAGLTNVLDFTGGFEAWQKAGKPVEK